MRVHRICSSSLRIIFIVGVCCLGVFANQESEANKVKYEFGAKLPKRDLIGQANQKRAVYLAAPQQNYRPLQKRLALLASEQRSDDPLEGIIKAPKPQVVITEHVTLSPKRSVTRPTVNTRVVELPKVKPSEIEAPNVDLSNEKLQSELSTKEHILETLARPSIESQIKEVTKPRKLKKYPQYYSRTYQLEGKDIPSQPVTQKTKSLQKPVAFSFNEDPKDKTQDNTVAGTEVHESGESKTKHREEDEEDGKKEPKASGSEHTEIREEEEEEEDHEKVPKEERSSFNKGGGSKHHSGHHSEKGDEGEKKFDGHENHEKSEKGHHDKEGHKGEYDEDKGHVKHHHHDDGYNSKRHQAEKGKKEAEYDEHSKYSKGWSTKGEHKIHRLDDYDKKKVFFDESHDEASEEDEGAFYEEKEFEKGGGAKGDHHSSGHHKDHYFKEGIHKKGGHYDDRKTHNEGDKHSKYHENHAEHGKKGGDRESKKWGRKHEEHSHHSHPVHEHRKPTTHDVWVGKRSDHDVADTQPVPATVQSSQKKGKKSKRHHQRSKKAVVGEPSKRDTNAQRLRNGNGKQLYTDAIPENDNHRYYFVIYH